MEDKHFLSPYMDIKEFAAYTKTTVRWAYSLTSKRLVPFIKAQGKILFHKETIDAWLLGQHVSTMTEFKTRQLINLEHSTLKSN